MNWIVLGTKGENIILTSKGAQEGVLPKGSYLTIEENQKNNKTKFILRVIESTQNELFSPSPLIVDMDLDAMTEDLHCKNTVHAVRIKDYSSRNDGLVDIIKPNLLARRSNQDEINDALGTKNGPKIFPATVFGSSNSKLLDEYGNYIYTKLPIDLYWHQIQITGKTGSGKTVASKYLAQHFLENEIKINKTESKFGAVLAINVKDIDFLTMDQPSLNTILEVNNEWDSLGLQAKGLDNYKIYYNATDKQDVYIEQGVNKSALEEITLDVKTIEPISLIGIVQSLTEIQQLNLPDIFRYWQNENSKTVCYYQDFLDWFGDRQSNNDNTFWKLDVTGRSSEIQLHPSTSNSILTKLTLATKYFMSNDTKDIKVLDVDDILVEGKLSVLNVSSDPDFGSIVLRDLLSRIMKAKDKGDKTPILIIIDEVHQFYKTSNSKQALGDLDTICRVGRSKKIGIIFSTQNEEDLPKGISNVVNTKLYFKTDNIGRNYFGVTQREIQSLKSGYGVGSIHGMPSLNVFKFPLSLSGVKE